MREHQTVKLLGKINVDKNIAPLIKLLWKKGIVTLESCEGGKDEPGFIITEGKRLPLIKDRHVKCTEEKGTGGYMPEDYMKKVQDNKTYYYEFEAKSKTALKRYYKKLARKISELPDNSVEHTINRRYRT